jgi:hypothetical protein
MVCSYTLACYLCSFGQAIQAVHAIRTLQAIQAFQAKAKHKACLGLYSISAGTGLEQPHIQSMPGQKCPLKGVFTLLKPQGHTCSFYSEVTALG